MSNHIGYRSGNPALTTKSFNRINTGSSSEVMTLEGAVNKTMICLVLLFASGFFAFRNAEYWMGLIWPLAIGGLIIAVITIFKKTWCRFKSKLGCCCNRLL